MSDLSRAAPRLEVLLDLRYPLAYLALHPTRAVVAEMALDPTRDIDWLPLEGKVLNAPSDPGPGDDRGVRHRRYRAQAIAREIDAYGAAQGLTLRDAYRSPDATPANRAWLWVRDRHRDRLDDFLVELFRAYWAVELDPSDEDAVSAMVDAIGADGGDYRAWSRADGRDAVAAQLAENAERGLFQAPAFVIDDEVFYGRQHLPMIRWILEGRSGPVPI